MIIFIFFCFKYDFYLFWFRISPLINIHRHQIPQWRTSELTGSVLLSKLTVGELLCWLNPSLSWAEVVAEHSRYRKKKKKKAKETPERRFLFISRWKLCWLSQFAQHIQRAGLFVGTSEGHIWSRAIDSDDSLLSSVILWASFFFRGLLGSCPTVWI